jgi:two-component system sensor histidine kinase HydH
LRIEIGEMDNHCARSGLSSWGPAACISTALVLVLVLGGWGAYRDWKNVGQTVLRSEITRIRSHAELTAGRLERQLAESSSHRPLAEVSQELWLRDHWAQFIPPPDRVYGAIVDPNGFVFAHSDPKLEGGKLCSDWNSTPETEAGQNVYSTDCLNLTGGPRTLDIVVPIHHDRVLLGFYHAGASQDWIDQLIASARQRSVFGWAAVIGGIVAVVLLSSVSLYQITRRSLLLENALRQSQARRLAELNYLMIGLAHEVRNPLNAVRLNLFTADRVFRGERSLDQEEVLAMLGESVREIDRIDSLVTLLLDYACVDIRETVTVNIADEIRSVAKFLSPTFELRGVTLEVDLSNGSDSLVQAGRGHVRQVLLNLLNNARDAVPEQHGRILIGLISRPDEIETTIIDNGPGIPSENLKRLFSPFFSTKDQGTGLGLALVRSLVERVGGHVECRRADPGHCEFQVFWPTHIHCENKS